MYLETSDHACPHLRETRLTEVRPVAAEPSRSAACSFSASPTPSQPLRLAATTASTGGGWWAFKTEALAMTARL